MINFNPSLVVPFFSIFDHQSAILMNQDAVIAKADSRRVAIIFCNTAGGSAFIRPNAAATNLLGFLVAVNSTTVMDFATWGAIVSAEWHVFIPAGGNFYVCELIYQIPEGD